MFQSVMTSSIEASHFWSASLPSGASANSVIPMLLSALITIRRMVAESSTTRHFIGSLRAKVWVVRQALRQVVDDVGLVVESAGQPLADLLEPFRRQARLGRPGSALLGEVQ